MPRSPALPKDIHPRMLHPRIRIQLNLPTARVRRLQSTSNSQHPRPLNTATQPHLQPTTMHQHYTGMSTPKAKLQNAVARSDSTSIPTLTVVVAAPQTTGAGSVLQDQIKIAIVVEAPIVIVIVTVIIPIITTATRLPAAMHPIGTEICIPKKTKTRSPTIPLTCRLVSTTEGITCEAAAPKSLRMTIPLLGA